MSFDAEFPEEPEENELEQTLHDAAAPWDQAPAANRFEARLQTIVNRLQTPTDLIRSLLDGVPVEVGAPDVTWRGTGLGRPGTIIHLAWPRLDSRIGVGIENTISHAIVDHLLGFSRLPVEASRQVTPVEFGVLTFVAARVLDRLDARPGPLGPWDMTIERVGPDAFKSNDLGKLVTLRLPVKMGSVQGAIRLWLSEALLSRVAIEEVPSPLAERENQTVIESSWRAEGGTITLPRGLGRVKVGGVLPLDRGTLSGAIDSPKGTIRLICDRENSVSIMQVEGVPGTSCHKVSVQSGITAGPAPERLETLPTEGPITLTIELGRAHLPVSALAELKVGDVVDLFRHTDEPIELVAGGKLIARGELVQIDTELGVRIKTVFI